MEDPLPQPAHFRALCEKKFKIQLAQNVKTFFYKKQNVDHNHFG